MGVAWLVQWVWHLQYSGCGTCNIVGVALVENSAMMQWMVVFSFLVLAHPEVVLGVHSTSGEDHRYVS